ncbi:Nucleoside triphosphate pyrophosphohydrolase/pyrophosphatase MazG [Cellulomonas sp. T2.31MG-18]|uniref:nucleoside triphosphate pyrophosphohydrolase n=1 Tax=Cellulomonas sp. T2.31MG-18 TaxID=3157619 RepID=UPI0035EA1427
MTTAPDGEPAAARDALRELVAVMDRLRSPGGCPWDAAQTHTSLLPYLLEESHELAEAVEGDDRAGLREELGDVLLQVVFHARIATEHPDDPFDLDDVARDLVAKLVRRHPHVFADAEVASMGALHTQWDRIKRAEKKDRGSALDGVPASLPALARAQKIASRAARAGLDAPVPADDELGAQLLELVRRAHAQGVDAEGALRRAAAAWETTLRDVEVTATASGEEVGTTPDNPRTPDAPS